MEIGIHTPSKVSVIVSLLLALLAIIGYLTATPIAAFWMAILAYVVSAVGVMVKT